MWRGGSSIEDLVAQGNPLFVDVTKRIYDMYEHARKKGDKCIFLTRPRRFGKSLMMSIFSTFFDGSLLDSIACNTRDDAYGEEQISKMASVSYLANRQALLAFRDAQMKEPAIRSQIPTSQLQGVKFVVNKAICAAKEALQEQASWDKGVKNRIGSTDYTALAESQVMSDVHRALRKVQFMRKTLVASIAKPGLLQSYPVINQTFTGNKDPDEFGRSCARDLYDCLNKPATPIIQDSRRGREYCDLLKEHLKNSNVIFVDEYDVPVQAVIKDQKLVEHVTTNIQAYMRITKEYSSKDILKYCVVTGSSKLAWCGLFSGKQPTYLCCI